MGSDKYDPELSQSNRHTWHYVTGQMNEYGESSNQQQDYKSTLGRQTEASKGQRRPGR
jgi:hypothetical protein